MGLWRESEGYIAFCDKAFLTADGGATWKPFPLGGPNWAYTDARGFPQVSIPVLFRTEDAGRTWQRAELSGKYLFTVRKLWFGFGLGFAATYRDLFRTIDDGRTWQPVAYARDCSTTNGGATSCQAAGPEEGERTRGLTQSHFFSTSEGVGIAEPARLAITRDGGSSWRIVPPATGWVVTEKSVYCARK